LAEVLFSGVKLNELDIDETIEVREGGLAVPAEDRRSSGFRVDGGPRGNYHSVNNSGVG
jgi:hypothetical protein